MTFGDLDPIDTNKSAIKLKFFTNAGIERTEE